MKNFTQTITKLFTQNRSVIVYIFTLFYLSAIYYIYPDSHKETATFFSGFNDIFVIYNLCMILVVLVFSILNQTVQSYITLFLKYIAICAYFVLQFYFVDYNYFDTLSIIIFSLLIALSICSIYGFVREFRGFSVNVYDERDCDELLIVICNFIYFGLVLFFILLSYIISAYILVPLAIISLFALPTLFCLNLISYTTSRLVTKT